LLSIAASSEWTVVLFEAPNRVTQLLADLIEVCGPERQAAVSRELTKVFEETRAGTLQDLSEHYAEAPARGEVTVVMAGTGKPRPEQPKVDPGDRAKALLAEGLSRKDVANRLAEETGISRNAAYKLVNEL
jgi:16S rRNA (cytidine1402-2'-O)-methyltransferase